MQGSTRRALKLGSRKARAFGFFNFPRGSRQIVLYCACRATVIHLIDPFKLVCFHSFKKGTQVSPSAAVERGPSQCARSGSTRLTWVSFHPLYRGGSASEKNCLLAPPHHSAATPCVSKGSHQAAPPSNSADPESVGMKGSADRLVARIMVAVMVAPPTCLRLKDLDIDGRSHIRWHF
jgi:hypothetical protein